MLQLPRIACFHGGGSNGKIFAVQCARLQDLLKDDFEFVYFDAPFECDAGPGVLPVFHDYQPFKRWFKADDNGDERSDGSGYDALGIDGVKRVWGLMNADGGVGKGKWVGAMGFSQGTRVVGGLLLDQQQRRKTGHPTDIDLKFGVLCMGGGAPMQTQSPPRMSNVSSKFGPCHPLMPLSLTFVTATSNHVPGNDSKSSVESKIEPISIPTLHLHGLKDSNLNNGRRQIAAYYKPEETTLYEIDYHHAMPWVTAEIKQFAGLLKQIYQKSCN